MSTRLSPYQMFFYTVYYTQCEVKSGLLKQPLTVTTDSNFHDLTDDLVRERERRGITKEKGQRERRDKEGQLDKEESEKDKRKFISRQIQDICSSTLRLFHDVKSLQNSTENKTMLEYIRKVLLPHFHTILSLSLCIYMCTPTCTTTLRFTCPHDVNLTVNLTQDDDL